MKLSKHDCHNVLHIYEHDVTKDNEKQTSIAPGLYHECKSSVPTCTSHFSFSVTSRNCKYNKINNMFTVSQISRQINIIIN